MPGGVGLCSCRSFKEKRRQVCAAKTIISRKGTHTDMLSVENEGGEIAIKESR